MSPQGHGIPASKLQPAMPSRRAHPHSLLTHDARQRLFGRHLEAGPTAALVEHGVLRKTQNSEADLHARATERIGETLVLDADADTIHVDTHGTEIILTGTVRSWAESNQACHAAWSIPGVTNVDNRLHVV